MDCYLLPLRSFLLALKLYLPTPPTLPPPFVPPEHPSPLQSPLQKMTRIRSLHLAILFKSLTSLGLFPV